MDIIENDRFARAMDRHPRLIERIFTPGEQSYCLARPNPVQHFAARFAAKEAIGKALGTGVLSWREIEISSGGNPEVYIHGSTRRAAARINAAGFKVSLSHSISVSVAVAVAEERGGAST